MNANQNSIAQAVLLFAVLSIAVEYMAYTFRQAGWISEGSYATGFLLHFVGAITILFWVIA